jgi:hypothetical protein
MRPIKHVTCVRVAVAAIGWLAICSSAMAQIPASASVQDSVAPIISPVIPSTPSSAAPVAVPLNDERIMKVIPDYQTVRDSSIRVAPMTAREKWNLGWKESIDPFNIASAAFTAAFSQRGNQTPKYGEGWPAYGQRFGAAVADFGTQNFFSAGVFATVLHQDPRYFRKGPQSKIATRIAYSISRLLICRQDSGKSAFNASNILGMGLGITASNVYYPSASRSGSVMAGRIETSMFGGVMGNLMSEFWPDIQDKFFRKKHKN